MRWLLRLLESSLPLPYFLQPDLRLVWNNSGAGRRGSSAQLTLEFSYAPLLSTPAFEQAASLGRACARHLLAGHGCLGPRPLSDSGSLEDRRRRRLGLSQNRSRRAPALC